MNILILLAIFTTNVALIAGNRCSKPTSISNGHYEFIRSPDWPETICRVKYSCDVGYKLDGFGVQYCFRNQWIGGTPACKVINCDALEAPVNGSMGYVENNAPDGQLDSIAQFACEDGFELDGDISLVCLPSGEWSADVPTCVSADCVADTCPVLSAPDNGNQPTCTDLANSGSECTFTCEPGFAVVGASTLICGEDGDYDNTPPICEDKCKYCGANTDCALGVCSCKTGYEAKLEDDVAAGDDCVVSDNCDGHGCVQGECVDGIGVHTCKCHPGWKGEICDTRIDCTELTNPANGEASCSGHDFDATCEYSCNAGFRLNGDSATLTCKENTDDAAAGKWSHVAPTCGVVLSGSCSVANSTSDCTDHVANSLCGDNNECFCDTGYKSNEAGTACETCELSYGQKCYFVTEEKIGSLANITAACQSVVVGSLPVEVTSVGLQDQLESLARGKMSTNFDNFWTGGQYNVADNTVMWNKKQWEAVKFKWIPTKPGTGSSSNVIFLNMYKDPAHKYNGIHNTDVVYYTGDNSRRVICQHD